MTPSELLALQDLEYENDHGETRRLKLRPPLSATERQRLAANLPPVLLDLLEVASGIAGAEHVAEGIDFTGKLEGQVLEEFLPDGVTLAVDGCGNGWSLEPSSGHIYFLCHDPPVVVFQSASLEDFLEQLKRQPSCSDLGENLQRWTDRIWRENPATLSPEQAAMGDSVLASFAAELGPDWWLIDLRQPSIGDGFSWGRYGPETEIRRHPEVAIVALRQPAAKPSLWRRLFGSKKQ